MSETADIAIIGGGFTGSSLAYRLANGQRRIVVFEARRALPKRFAGELLHPGRLAVLGEALLSRLRSRGADIFGFAVFRRHDEPGVLLPYDEAHSGRGLGIDHSVLVDELRRAAAAQPGVTFHYGARAMVRFEGERAVGVDADDGTTLSAPLTLSAEGRHSHLRSHLAVPTETRLVSFTAALRVHGGELPHPGYGHVFLGAPGPILAYPISATDIRLCFDLPAEAEADAKLRQRLLREYAVHVPAPLREHVIAALHDGELRMVANHAIRTDRCVAPGVALVGDAGGCAHPLTAAGMSVCLNDIMLLVQELEIAEATAWPLDSALNRFQERRYQFVRVRETLTDALYRLLEHHGPSGEALRGALFEHWRQARTDSVALLSCESSNRERMRREWQKVALRALGGVLRGESGSRVLALHDLARFAAAQLPSLLQ